MNINGEKFSFSKLDTYNQCKFKYKLKYVDKHFVGGDSIATDFGTIMHAAEESIANCISSGDYIDYLNIRIKFYEDSMALKNKYPFDFNVPDKSGRTMEQKIMYYATEGINRLENYMKEHSNLKIVGIEKEFTTKFENIRLNGRIDRILQNTDDNSLVIQDIKSYAVPVEKDKLATPLQFVVYSMATQNLFPGIDQSKTKCQYDLPLCGETQDAGTSGFMTRGTNKLSSILSGITKEEFSPNPTALCHWCEFCPTNDNQKEEGKGLCPYYCLWTQKYKSFNKACEWAGMENHQRALEEVYGRNKESRPV